MARCTAIFKSQPKTRRSSTLSSLRCCVQHGLGHNFTVTTFGDGGCGQVSGQVGCGRRHGSWPCGMGRRRPWLCWLWGRAEGRGTLSIKKIDLHILVHKGSRPIFHETNGDNLALCGLGMMFGSMGEVHAGCTNATDAIATTKSCERAPARLKTGCESNVPTVSIPNISWAVGSFTVRVYRVTWYESQ